MGETACVSDEQKRSALAAVVESDTFARSDQLRGFMGYIGEMAISGKGREITEYLIAVNALGRPADFSPTDDSSVRSRAHELRRKLQKYYELENPGAPLRVVLPRGAYCPRFVPREEAAGIAAAEARETAGSGPALEELPAQGIRAAFEPRPEAALPRRRLSRRDIVFLVVLVLAVPCSVWLGYSLTKSSQIGPKPDAVVTEALGPLAQPDANVVLCVATALHLIVRPYMAVVAEGLPKYPAPAELYPLFRQHRPLSDGTELDMHPVDNSVQMGHVAGLLAFSRLLDERGVHYQVLPERASRVTAMRGRNVMLIGEPQNSEAVALYLERMPITLAYDPILQDVVIQDRRRPGSPRSFQPKRGQDKRYTEVYGLITVTATPGAAADQRSVIISGLTSVGAQGAAEFFSSGKAMSALRDRLRKEGQAGFPPGYQVVVRCNSRDTLLLSTEYETHVSLR